MKATITFILSTLFFVASGQQIRFDRFDISNGLSQNNINCMEFDASGRLWIGTLDGLNCYDGNIFHTFKPNRTQESCISGSDVTAIGAGLKDNMWIITRGGGLDLYDASKQRFRKFDLAVLSPFNVENVSVLRQQNDSLLWLVAQTTVGCWNIKTNRFIKHEFESQVRGIEIIDQNAMLVYGPFGMYRISRPESKISQFTPVFLSEGNVLSVFKNDTASFCLLPNGIHVLNEKFKLGSSHFFFDEKLTDKIKQWEPEHFVINQKYAWIGGDNFFVRADIYTGKGEEISYDPLHRDSFKGYSVSRILLDPFRNLWIGTHKNGINHFGYLKNQFRHYRADFNLQSDPESNPVRALLRTKEGDLWMAFDRDGVGVMKKDGLQKFYRNYFDRNQKNHSILNVRNIFEDSNGDIWIGMNNGLCIYNDQEDKIESVNCRYPWSWPFQSYSISEFETGILAISSMGSIGFVNLDDGTLTTLSASQTGGSVRDMQQDMQRNLWVAKNDNGIIKYNYPDLHAKLIDGSTSGLSDEKVYCMLAMGNYLWVGTNNGLNKLDITSGTVIQQYFEEDGLSNNVVYSLYADKGNMLWMSTSKGISRFDPIAERFSTFLISDFFMDDAHDQSADGKILYGGYTGVVEFDPGDIEFSSVEIEPVLESFTLAGNTVFVGDTIDGQVPLKTALNSTRYIQLKHHQNTFGMQFNAYPFNYPNSQDFRYRLLGWQDEWTTADQSRNVIFTRLPPGNYTFEMEVKDNFGHILPGKTLEIEIVPPFWARTRFKAGMAVLAVLFVIILFRVRVARINQRNKWLNQKVNEQTSELRQQNKTILEISEKLHEADQSKLRFFTNVSHEFRTPLTLILGQLENIHDEPKSAIRSIRKNATRLQKLINQLLDLRKLDQDQMKLMVSEFDLISFIDNIVESFQSMAKNRNINLTFTSHVKELPIWLDEDKTEKILFNLISNAIKYSPDGVRVQVQVHLEEDACLLKVIDEGMGIAVKDQARVFERFYRSEKNNSTVSGYGIGLSMVKGLVEVQKGNVVLESQLGKGSTFTVKFKLGNQHFEKSDLLLNQKNNEIETIQQKPFFASKELMGKKILIVEDNLELNVYLNDLLSRHFAVQTAENGKEALEKVESIQPDLIVSDLMMPVMGGIEFCRRLKGDLKTSHIPVILLTAKTDEKTKLECFEIGVDDYVEKPFQTSVFLARIQALLANREKLKSEFENAARKMPLARHVSQGDRKLLERIDLLIQKNMEDFEFSVESICRELHMSRATFYRKFTDLTGASPADYLRRIRLRAAYQLLVKGDESIETVSEKVGFKSSAYFRKSFKNEFGKTPSLVRKELN